MGEVRAATRDLWGLVKPRLALTPGAKSVAVIRPALIKPRRIRRAAGKPAAMYAALGNSKWATVETCCRVRSC